jgi:phosphohistidine phosphatase
MMRIYLVQHGKSKSKQEDPARSLSDEGIEEVTRTSNFLSRSGLSVTLVRHSGKRRAEQTALLLVQEAKLNADVEKGEGLAPLDDPQLLADSLSRMSEDVMLVGHLPHLERLASLLLTGQSEAGPVRFHNAGVICLERGEGRCWSLTWAVTPELLAGEADR